jgi:hypothetical protein
MTDNERELLNTIRQSNDPEKALITAISIITAYLKQPLSAELDEVVCPQALA